MSLERVKVGQKIKDTEDNIFIITGGYEDKVTLKGQGGEKEISVWDLEFYFIAPPLID